jgi:hypothetical protein
VQLKLLREFLGSLCAGNIPIIEFRDKREPKLVLSVGETSLPPHPHNNNDYMVGIDQESVASSIVAALSFKYV